MSTCSKCGARYPNNVRFCTADGTVLEEDAPAETELVGKVLAGKYRLDAYLSKGGMGSVFRATHLMLEKPVALKVIKPELVGSSEFVRRFQREARAATSLNHPNIVGVYDLGQTDDGTLYIAMEFVDGASLKDVIRKSGPMDSIRIVRIMRQILGALALAHRHHIVHRDLKPQNIMLTHDRDGNEIAKLVDFGIAKTFDDRTQLTATGFAIGTPQYMAPEQAAGTEVDGRSDLYSLGIILYEMLVAEVPFNDPSTPAILVKHLTEVPVRPSQRRTDVAVHRGLEDVAVRCLEKDPGKRFQTAEDVTQALAAAVSLDESASSVSDAATLPMHARHLTVATTRTAAPAAAPDGSMAPTVATSAHQDPGAAPTVLDPAPTLSGATAPTVAPAAPSAMPSATAPATVAPPAATAAPATPAAGAPAPTMSAAPPVPVAVTPAMPPASMHPQAPPPVVKSGRSSLALGVGALAIVALAGMGFAIQQFVGDAEPESASVLPAASAEPPPRGAESLRAEAPVPTTPAPPPAAEAPVSSGAGAPAGRSTPAGGTGPRVGASPERRTAGDARGTARQGAQPLKTNSAGAGASVPASSGRAEAVPPPAAPPAPQLAAQPTVLLRCDGAVEICGAVRDAFGSVLERQSLPLTSNAQRADVYIVVSATALDGQVQQQFGTTFVVRNYTIAVELEAPKMEMTPGAPPSRTFSADLRVGRERVNENARLVAVDTVQKIREFWTKQRARD